MNLVETEIVGRGEGKGYCRLYNVQVVSVG